MIQALLFDVDGCLIDSFESNLDFFQKLMKHFGFEGPTREEYKHLFHFPTIEVVKKVSGLKDEKKIKEIADFGGSDAFPYETLPLPLSKGVAETLPKLSKKYTLGIITSRVRDGVFASEELKKFKDLFSVVIAYEDTKKHKPGPEPILEAAKRLKVQPAECVYIGDAQSDKKAGKGAGTHVILYAKENYEKTELDTEDFSEIPKLIENI